MRLFEIVRAIAERKLEGLEIGAIMMHPDDVTDEVRKVLADAGLRLIESGFVERGSYGKVHRDLLRRWP